MSELETVKRQTTKQGNAMKKWNLVWSPTGQVIAQNVEAKTQRAAIRKAPAPHRKYLGEIYAVEV